MNDAAIVMQCQAAIDRVTRCQKEDHLLPGPEATESKTVHNRKAGIGIKLPWNLDEPGTALVFHMPQPELSCH